MVRAQYPVAVILVLLGITLTIANDETHVYKKGESVKVYANKIGPFHNSFETYDFFKEPGCHAKKDIPMAPSIGQALAGDDLFELSTDIEFEKSLENSLICTFKPDENEIARWETMIGEHYSYQLVIDDLPVWGAFGKVGEGGARFIYLHRAFYFGINQNQIVNVTLKTGMLSPLKAHDTYSFSYSVHFSPSTIKFEDRFTSYVDQYVFQPKIRWLSIGNSVMIVLGLVLLATVIVFRTLRKDYAKIDEDRKLQYEGHDTIDESGWRQLYADVFRIPRYSSVLCAFLGSGIQLLTTIFIGIGIAVLDSMHPSPNHRKITYIIIAYGFASFIAGFVSGYQFMEFSAYSAPLSSKWIRCLFLTVTLYPGYLLLGWLFTNVLAAIYGSAQVVHISGILYVLTVWLFVSCPFTLAGTMLSRYYYRRGEKKRIAPHINHIPRIIPRPRNIFSKPHLLLVASGILPFATIFVELHLVFSSIWLYKLYYLYGFLVFTSVIFVIVTICVSIAATFVLLSTENHQWRWMSVGFGASCAFYVLVYSLYFYFFKTKMNGMFMFAFFFSYSTSLAVMIATVGGAIAYFAASVFVKRIYVRMKDE